MKESQLDDKVKADGYGIISVLFNIAGIFIYDAVEKLMINDACL